MAVPSFKGPQVFALAVWVTNEPSYGPFLLNRMLPRWDFTYHNTWFWLKMYANGGIVAPVELTHRLSRS